MISYMCFNIVLCDSYMYAYNIFGNYEKACSNWFNYFNLIISHTSTEWCNCHWCFKNGRCKWTGIQYSLYCIDHMIWYRMNHTLSTTKTANISDKLYLIYRVTLQSSLIFQLLQVVFLPSNYLFTFDRCIGLLLLWNFNNYYNGCGNKTKLWSYRFIEYGP